MKENSVVYLSIGSNVGDRLDYLNKALELIEEDGQNRILKKSAIYETEPVGFKNQAWFLNQCVSISTKFLPLEFLKLCQNIENKLGRVRTERFGPRMIDVDILLYDDLFINEPDLQIPHPRMKERRFVLLPLAEIAGEVILSGEGKMVKELLEICSDWSVVRKNRV